MKGTGDTEVNADIRHGHQAMTILIGFSTIYSLQGDIVSHITRVPRDPCSLITVHYACHSIVVGVPQSSRACTSKLKSAIHHHGNRTTRLSRTSWTTSLSVPACTVHYSLCVIIF